MTRGLKITAGVALGIVALLALILALLAAFDWNKAKPWINQRVSEAAQRPFAINGDLTLSWTKPAVLLEGWRRWVPWPHLRAYDVTLGNPDWASTGPTMAQVQQIDFNINPLRLLRKTISVSSLILTEPDLILERDKDGRNNWTFGKKEEESESPWRMDLQDLALTRGTIRLVDATKRADITARVDTENEGQAIRWKVAGKFNGEKLSGNGTAGALLSLQERGVKYPVKAELHVGKTDIYVDGTFTDPARFSELDVNLKILGASMAQLFPLTGVLLPETPRFSTEGRLAGKVGGGNTQLRYEKFKGKVGSSDIAGTLEFIQQQPRSMLRGDVASTYLNFKDLGALVGADSPAEQKKRGVTSKQPPGKALPVAPFKTDRWSKLDVQVEFTGRKIIRSEELPLDSLYTKIRMDNGVLTLAPLNFGAAGGKFTTELKIDGQGEPVKAQMKIAARGLQLKRLFPKVESMQASLGELNGDAQLSATGNSIAALLGSSNGQVKALISQGTVSKFILEAMGLNVGSVVLTKLFGDRQVQLNCMATDFVVTDGLMRPRVFVMDTEDAIVHVGGEINLASERLALEIQPESKGLRIISLRSPLYVSGTFKNPDVGVDKGVVALKAGAAVALSTLAAPLAGLLALINPGPTQDSPCAKLVAQAQQKPQAPPPGKKPVDAPAAKK